MNRAGDQDFSFRSKSVIISGNCGKSGLSIWLGEVPVTIIATGDGTIQGNRRLLTFMRSSSLKFSSVNTAANCII